MNPCTAAITIEKCMQYVPPGVRQSLVPMRLHCRQLCNNVATSSLLIASARRSRGWDGCCSWVWLSAPAFRLGAGNCVPPPFRAREPQSLEARSFHGMASWLLQIGGLRRSERPIHHGTTTWTPADPRTGGRGAVVGLHMATDDHSGYHLSTPGPDLVASPPTFQFP